MSSIHPLAAEHLRKRWTRHDAYRFAPPGSPEAKTAGWLDPRRWPYDVAAAEEDAAEREALERKLLQLRHELAALKLDYALRRFHQKYSPDQPRVPAGDPDGGQWTSGPGGSGAGRDDQRVVSGATPYNVLKPGAQYAANERLGYPVDLQEEEARGGHAIEKHVNRSPEALTAQVREVFDERPYARDVRSGSFSSLEAATKLVNSTLAQNQVIVDQVASGMLSAEIVKTQFNSITGIEAVAASISSSVNIRETYGVGVIVVHDPSSPRGYTVLTAFPSNQR